MHVKDSHLFIIFKYSYLMKDMNDIKLCKLYSVFYALKCLINK